MATLRISRRDVLSIWLEVRTSARLSRTDIENLLVGQPYNSTFSWINPTGFAVLVAIRKSQMSDPDWIQFKKKFKDLPD